MTQNISIAPRLLFRVSEVFYSIQGEGPYTGFPMIFVRLFGCNFTCSGFSNPNEIPIASGFESDLPTLGCDSIYSWHHDYKASTELLNVRDLIDKMLKLLKSTHWHKTRTGLKPILCFTGGEPLLHQKALISLLDSSDFKALGVDKILFETNCAIPLSDEFKNSLLDWLNANTSHRLIWSNSPKLSLSGEPAHKAIRPSIYADQLLVPAALSPSDRIHQYLKFVSDGTKESFNEIEHAVSLYKTANSLLKDGVVNPQDIWVMPVGHTTSQQELVQRKVAERCLDQGYMFSGRLHCWIWNNQKGT